MKTPYLLVLLRVLALSKQRHRLSSHKTRFWPFDKISSDVSCDHLNITHGIYDDEEAHVKHSCKCGFDLFYFGQSTVKNQLAKASQTNLVDLGYDCWDIAVDTCHLKGRSPSDMPVGLKMQSGYFDEDRRFIIRYKKWVYKPYFEHLFTAKDFKLFGKALGSVDNDVICNRLCMGLMDERVPGNIYATLQNVVCFGDSYPPNS